jgi:hypothetical protein
MRGELGYWMLFYDFKRAVVVIPKNKWVYGMVGVGKISIFMWILLIPFYLHKAYEKNN